MGKMMTRDLVNVSALDPLRIDEIQVGDHGGLIGLSLCPGKTQHVDETHFYKRNLDQDVAAMRVWSPDAVVSLIEIREFFQLDVAGLPDAYDAAGLSWHHMPILEKHAPCEDFERAWRFHRDLFHHLLDSGGRVLIHSNYGLGRAATVAAKLLIESHCTAQQAVNAVRLARGVNAIQTKAQAEYLFRLDQSVSTTTLQLRDAARLAGGLF